MSRKALEWAQRLRAELVERVDELRTMLADIEPLRQELARLESQLEGVERLISVYVNQIGPVEVAHKPEPPAPEPASIAAVVSAEPRPQAPPSLGDAARVFGQALVTETQRVVAAAGERIAKGYIAIRLWLTTVLRRTRAL